MDLNLDNYSNEELINILQVPDQDINISNLQISLSNKIEQIKTIDSKDLPENKENLLEFYAKVMMKLLNSITLLNITENKPVVKNFEPTLGNSYNSSLDAENSNKEFISVQEKLLLPLSYGPTVQQNNHFISRHNDMKSTNTFNSNLKYGEINPLTRKSFKKVLNINTKFRNNYTTTASTNFSLELPSTIKKVVSLKLIESQFPEMVYTVSDKLGSNSFIAYSDVPAGPFTIVIPNGSYSSTTIVTAINTALAIAPIDISLSYNEDNSLMTFTENGGFNLSLNFDYTGNACPQLPSNIYKDQLTLGWLLGFRGNYILPINSTISNKSYKLRNARSSLKPNNYLKNNIICCPEFVKNQVDISNIYISNSSYTGESLFDPHGTRYFLVSINDYQNNHNTSFISPFQNQSLADNNIIAKVTTECCKKCCVEQPERIYFGPIDLTKLEIKIFDEFGRIVDINNADYSLTLELEILYDL